MSIDFDVSDGVARVTLNRPERLNAIDSASEATFAGIWNAIAQNPTIRCVVLTGTGRASAACRWTAWSPCPAAFRGRLRWECC